MKSLSNIRIFAGLLVLPLLLAMASVTANAQTSNSDKISQLLTEAKILAVQAEDDADILESFAHSKLSWQTHSGKLEEIKDHVNALGRVDRQLNEMSASGIPWQQKAIAEIHPLLEEMANELSVTINHLSENRSQLHLMPYMEHAENLHDRASRTAELIRDYIEYEKAKAKVDFLQQKLQLANANQG